MSLLNKIFPSREEPGLSEQESRIRLVAGLGNPGPEYEKTRHNIGFELLDRIAEHRGLKWSRERKFRARIASESSDLILCKPLTYMNLSGDSVSRLARYHKMRADQILVIYDDVSLPVGRIRFRAGGSAGGHNGMKSIIDRLATDEFPRLKIGIGDAHPTDGMVDHVLGKFREEEWTEMEKVLAIAEDGVNCALSAGVNSAMNNYNQRSGKP